jgi:predicted phosphodiesterase
MRQPLFTFAVISDTHIKPEHGDESSPYKTNLMANDRSRWVVSEIERLKPDFVVHLGDLVQPVPSLPTYPAAADAALEIFKPLTCPIHWTAGNHDVGDKPLDWMPAAKASQEAIDTFRKRFRKDYSSFEFRECRFVLVNDCILNSNLPCEKEQKKWLEKELSASKGKRLFLFTHYPPYMFDRDELGNYDNVDEPGRGWFLKLAEKHKAEALFAGHVHHFGYDRFSNTDYYRLPSVTFVRHDYGEFFRIGPADEGGRNDLGKFGFVIVKVYEDGHTVHLVRTHGKTLEKGKQREKESRFVGRHPGEKGSSHFGVHLRHSWSEVIDLPYNGPLEEFQRKRLRNDYPLMLLWEMGVQKLRVPIGDLLDSHLLQRMKFLVDQGHRFTFFSYEIPDKKTVARLIKNKKICDTWEIIVKGSQAKSILKAAAGIKKKISGVKLTISRLETAEDHAKHGSKFSHFSNHGFVTERAQEVDDFVKEIGSLKKSVDALVFRIPLSQSAWKGIHEAVQISAQHGFDCVPMVQLTGNTMASVNDDDLSIANRVAESIIAGASNKGADIFLDTFLDHDRGHFMRNGLADRRCNPRTAGKVYQHLHAALDHELNGVEGPWECNDAKDHISFRLSTSRKELLLVLPKEGSYSWQNRGRHYVYNLVEGTRSSLSENAFLDVPSLIVNV